MDTHNQLESLCLSPVHIVHILSKLDTVSGLRYLAHVRSVKYGFGNKSWFRAGLLYMVSTHPDIVSNNLQSIVDFGCWKDLYILMNTSVESEVVSFYAKQLTIDLHILQREQYNNLSMAAKWVLREKSQINKRTNFISKLCAQLDITRETLRKTYLTPLRSALQITETLMCANKWSSIDYSRVPRECLRRNCKLFLKHDKKRFSEYVVNSDSTHIDKREVNSRSTDMYSLGIIPRRTPRTLEKYNTATNSNVKLYVLGDTSGSCKLNSVIDTMYRLLISGSVNKWISWADCTEVKSIPILRIQEFLESQVSNLETDLSTAVETILTDNSCPAILYIMTDTDLDSTFCRYKEFLANTELQTRLQTENRLQARLQIVHWNCNYKYVEILPPTNSYFRCIRGRDDYLIRAVASKHSNLASKYIREISLSFSYLRINSRRQFTLDVSNLASPLQTQNICND